MLFTKRNILKNSSSNKLKIISDSGMMGIINSTDNSCILPVEYDNVFIYGADVFVVHKKGKIGAVMVESEKVCFIAECEFDTLDTFGHDLIFSNDQKVRYYNSATKKSLDFIDIVVDFPCLYCKDERFQYILYGEQGEIIHKKEYTSYSESCFCHCGETDKGPVFYDARYSTYLYPTEDGYKVYKELFNHPIIINRRNVANITEGENGIGLIDSYGNPILDNRYDSIKVELKITAIKGERAENKIIPFSKNTFEKGEISEIEDWM